MASPRVAALSQMLLDALTAAVASGEVEVAEHVLSAIEALPEAAETVWQALVIIANRRMPA